MPLYDKRSKIFPLAKILCSVSGFGLRLERTGRAGNPWTESRTMRRTTLTACLLGLFVLPSSGCMTCCQPIMPWEGAYCGCVDSGPFGGPRTLHAERREMRRALRNSFGMNQCPACGGGFDSGFAAYDGMSNYAMQGGGTCPTCQQNVPMNGTFSQPMEGAIYGSPSMGAPSGMEVQPHPMSSPTPAPMGTPAPTPVPGSVPGPTAAPNSTSQFYPTGMSPVFNHTAAALEANRQTYRQTYGQSQNRPAPIQPFNAPPAQSYSYVPQQGVPLQGQMSQIQYPAQYSVQTQIPSPAMQTSAEMMYIPAQPGANLSSSVQQALYAP